MKVCLRHLLSDIKDELPTVSCKCCGSCKECEYDEVQNLHCARFVPISMLVVDIEEVEGGLKYEVY